MKVKLTLLFLCLLVLSFAQNECQESRLTEIQTGEILLNPNDLGTAGANKNYYESLSRGEFEAGDLLGYAFAIAGFETSCSQQHYSLMVDVVQFQNQNTKMRIVIDFRNPDLNALTTWTKVKLTYLVVSSARYEGAAEPAFIWATNTQVALTGNIAGAAVFRDSTFGLGDQTGCGLVYESGDNSYSFGITCDTDSTDNNDFEHDVAIHAYIMGFQYQPNNASTGQFLAASARFNSWMNNGYQSQVAFVPSHAERDDIVNSGGNNVYGIRMVYADSGVNGPQFTISNYAGELRTIKIAIVITVINPRYGNDAADNGFASLFSYSYSGLYTVVDNANYNNQAIIDNDGAANYNNLHENLPVKKYIIYGLSQFELADGSGCSSFNIDISIDTVNSYTVSLNNANHVNNIIFQADIYSPATRSLCNPEVEFTSLIYDQDIFDISDQLQDARDGQYENLRYILTRKSYEFSTVPSNIQYQEIIQERDNPLNLRFKTQGLVNDTTNVRYNATVIMQGIIDGKPYGIRVYLRTDSDYDDGTGDDDDFHTPTNSSKYQFMIKVNGFTLFNKILTPAELQTIANANTNDDKFEQFFGINLKGTTATFEYILIIPRNPRDGADYEFSFFVDLFQFQQVYDPVTECCVTKCPAQTGLDVAITPASCISCDASKGLTYNPSTASCSCKEGFYQDASLDFQCFACKARLCSSCNTTRTDICITCAPGAALNQLDNTCSCMRGFYQNGNACNACPAKCATCSVSNTCQTCADIKRDINKNCSCIAGYYDAGIDKCQECNSNCATCANSTTCLSCDARKFRTLKGAVCVCEDGFFELVHQNGTRECKPCSKECGTCALSATECTSCNANINRIEGYDSLGHRTCICKAGYHALADGSCVQSNCNADKYCSQCEKDLALCIQCRASINRVIKLPEHVCVCADGYYEDTNGDCKPCSSGCAKCTSATQCTTCVAQGTNNGNGTCKCAAGTFFTISTSGVRYCSKCIDYCNQCNNSLTCTICKNGFVLSSDNTCVCPKRNFINTQGQCVPCKSGCQTCVSNTTCSKCVAPLLVEKNACVSKCSEGFFVAGSVCVGCPDNCIGCTSTNQCYYCKDGFYLHAGACYAVCPAGTVPNKSTFQCTPCNSPCRTCSNHPSTCTSCEPGEGYLQVTATEQKCVKQCAEGTFPKNNVCEVCDFRCAKCLGAASNCIACPAGRFLYNGACWDYCPGVMVNNQCINSCPSGYYRQSDQQCKPCNSQCNTCQNNSTCTTCKTGFVTKDGKCIASCGDGYYEFRGLCVACDKACKSCKNIPTQCIECAKGYVKLGSKCVSSCAENTYLDVVSSTCRPCSSTCKTCSAENYCTSCPNNQIAPVGGQCLSCIYPCETCSADLSTCNTCLSGFYLSSGQCVRTCPTGTRPVNGVCSCSSGLFLEGTCVSSCPSGYTKVNSTCRRCESPCTQCSGSTNFCTDCLDTYTLKPSTGSCQNTSVCNYGQQQYNGQCVRICVQGSYYQNGACIFGGCPEGFKDNGFGGCVPASTNTNRCQPPTFRLNGVCIENCGNGYFPNSNTRACETCATNCQNCLNKNYCLACATGYSAVDGKCISQSVCPGTQVSWNGACIASCPNGTFTNNGRCIRSCPSGSYYFGGVCYRTCPTQAQYSTENACVATCPSGTTLIDRVCAAVV